jgi:hypothetical protein
MNANTLAFVLVVMAAVLCGIIVQNFEEGEKDASVKLSPSSLAAVGYFQSIQSIALSKEIDQVPRRHSMATHNTAEQNTA